MVEFKDPGDGEFDEELRHWLDEMTFTDQQWAAARERRRREEEDKRRIFGDANPFPIPDTDTDA